MKKSLFIAALAACVLSACAVEPVPGSTEEPMVYREYTATIADDATKVTFGEAADGKVPVSWTEGDLVLLSDGTTGYSLTVSAINGSSATLTGETAASFTPTAAYYPASMYDASGNFTLGKQTYGSVPAPMTGTVSDNAITFFAAEGYSVVRYSLTGDITIKEAYLYYRDKAAFWERDNVLASRNYTLTFTSPLTLASNPQYIYFVVPTGTKVLTLEVVTDAPETAYKMNESAEAADYSYYRRKTTAVELASGKVYDMPQLAFNKSALNTERHIWEFGTNNNPENGTLGWSATNSGSVTAAEDHATVTMATDKNGKYRSDLVYPSEWTTNFGTYRYVAVKFNAPAVVNGTIVPQGATLGSKGAVKFDVKGFGNWRGNSASNKTCTIATVTENCEIWVYDMLVAYDSSQAIASTVEDVTIKATAGFKVADLELTGESFSAPTYDVYWIGSFNSIDEIRAYVAADENLTELPSTSLK